jgi:SAM-dependent methyltransferase
MDRLKWIREQVQEGEKIVDIGSNDGHTFIDTPFMGNVTNVDIDQHPIWNFVRADAAKLPFEDKSFDVAVLAEIIEHVPDPVAVIKEANRVAKRLILTVPNEHKWTEIVKPFNTTAIMREKGIDIAHEARQGNANVTEFYTEDNYEHLWHARFYTMETLHDDLSKAGIKKFEINEGNDENFVWFLVTTGDKIEKQIAQDVEIGTHYRILNDENGRWGEGYKKGDIVSFDYEAAKVALEAGDIEMYRMEEKEVKLPDSLVEEILKEAPKFVCKVCGKVCKNAIGLSGHSRSHTKK